MLSAARQRTSGLPNVELHDAPLESLPIGDGECDAVLLILALSYVAEPASVLAEAARVLRPGGKAVVVDLLRHDREDFQHQMGQRHPGFDLDSFEAAMAGAGLQAAACRELPPEPEAKGPALFLASARRPATVLPLPGPRKLAADRAQLEHL
jgi:ArsR family transcriptional regulator